MAIVYGTDVSFTITALNSLASSSTITAGWTSESVNNVSSPKDDYLIAGQVQVNTGSAPTANTYMELWAYCTYNDVPTWPSLFSSGTAGTAGAATVRDTEIKASGMALLWSSLVDADTSDYYVIKQVSIAEAFGEVPPYFAVFFAHNTGQNLNSSGNALWYMPVTYSV